MKNEFELRDKENELYDALEEAITDSTEYEIIKAKLDTISFLLGEGDCITEKELTAPESDDELEELISALRSERNNVPEYSAFGNPNWACTDAQIEIVEWTKEE